MKTQILISAALVSLMCGVSAIAHEQTTNTPATSEPSTAVATPSHVHKTSKRHARRHTKVSRISSEKSSEIPLNTINIPQVTQKHPEAK